MIDKYELTFQDKYDAEYARGYRLGGIEASREIAIRFIKTYGKPSKRLIHKINREVDCRILHRFFDLFLNQSTTVETLEDIYDTLTPSVKDVDEDYDNDDP
jgi:hypothetical protein